MRAVTVVPGQAHSVAIRDDVPEPHPEDGQAVVRVVETGVCGTDAEIDAGQFGEAPEGSPYLILGHENLGVVERAAGAFRAGDLVLPTVRRPCPERCRSCVDDQQDMCLTGNYRERGIKGLHGFMVDRYVEWPRYLVRIPEAMREVGVLVETISFIEKGVEQALRIQQRLVWDPHRALVIGAGPVGLLAALTFRLRGMEVTVASRGPADSPAARLVASGGMRYVGTKTRSVEDVATEVGGFDVVFEASGAAAMIAPAMKATGNDGVCVLGSVTPEHSKVDFDLAAWNRELVLGNRVVLGTVNAARRHFEAGVRDLGMWQERHPGWLSGVITRRLPVEEVKEAFQKRPGDIKSVLRFA